MSLQEQLEKVQSDLQKIEETTKRIAAKREGTAELNWNWKKQGLQQKRMRKSERL